MRKTISTRLDEKEIAILNKIASEEHMDRSSLIRKFLLKQIEQFNMKKMANYYHKGVVSIQEAAYQARVNLYQMMDYLQSEKIFPPSQSDAEIQKDLERSRQVFEKL